MRIVQASDLLAKYVEMRALRTTECDNPRPRLRALSEQFPGALREIDQLPLDVIDARIAALERGATEPWMRATALFHVQMREALRIKRTLGRRPITDALRARIFQAHPSARAWDLERLARPPRGRVSEFVCERIAREMNVAPAEVRTLVFGAQPSRPASAGFGG